MEESLGLDAASVKKFVFRRPPTVCASLEDNLQKKRPWLVHNLHLPRDEVLKVVSKMLEDFSSKHRREFGTGADTCSSSKIWRPRAKTFLSPSPKTPCSCCTARAREGSHKVAALREID